jgi:catechol 2,3-dioxygenase-like lactoylglutathione lyase family enzyme
MRAIFLSPTKRWVTVAPPGRPPGGCRLLLAKASDPDQAAVIGRQTGGRVFLFLHTDDFDRDHRAMLAKGVRFIEEPRVEPYGNVVVFEDAFGNLWDLVQTEHLRDDRRGEYDSYDAPATGNSG